MSETAQTRVVHPTYPIRHGAPAMDRCTCGGVRHWHAVAPYGCDDCECTEFVLDENWRPGHSTEEIATRLEQVADGVYRTTHWQEAAGWIAAAAYIRREFPND